MGWVTRKEYCEHEGIKFRAFKYRKKSGLLQWRYGSSGRGGEAGKRIEVWVEDSLESGVRSLEIPKVLNDKKKTRVHRGEPGCRDITPIINGEPYWIPASAVKTNIDAPPSESQPLLDPLKEPTPACADLLRQGYERQNDDFRTSSFVLGLI